MRRDAMLNTPPPLPANADNKLGNDLASALSTVLKPRKNESGTWSYPRSIKELLLNSECSLSRSGGVVIRIFFAAPSE